MEEQINDFNPDYRTTIFSQVKNILKDIPNGDVFTLFTISLALESNGIRVSGMMYSVYSDKEFATYRDKKGES